MRGEMAANNYEQRYEDILRKIAGRRPYGGKARDDKPRKPHDAVLDGLNAYDSLAALAERDYEHILCHGPETKNAAAWSAVLIWFRNKGYHGYKRLTLLGIWAHYSESEMALSLGTRNLAYQAPIYDAGVYRVAIESGFQLYYGDDGRPPNENEHLHYSSLYSEKKRLTLRQALREILAVLPREIDRA